MIFGILFASWRFLQIVTLIPIMGMLAYFVHIYASNNLLTPTYILILFIVSVLGVAWTIATLFTYHRSKSNATFVGIIDLCFFGALIAAVYELRGITGENCSSVNSSQEYIVSFGIFGTAIINGITFDVKKQCAMLKASFALGIMNVVFFFITGLLALFHGNDRTGGREKERVVVEERYVSRHGSRHGGSRHGSRRSGSHRSGHSRRGAYV